MIHKPVRFDPPIHIPHGFADREGNIRRFAYGGQEWHIASYLVDFVDVSLPTVYEGYGDDGTACVVQRIDGKWCLIELRPPP